MAITEGKITAEVVRRSLAHRVVRFPFVCGTNYRAMRKHGNGVLVSICGAWICCGFVIRFGGKTFSLDRAGA